MRMHGTGYCFSVNTVWIGDRFTKEQPEEGGKKLRFVQVLSPWRASRQIASSNSSEGQVQFLLCAMLAKFLTPKSAFAPQVVL